MKRFLFYFVFFAVIFFGHELSAQAADINNGTYKIISALDETKVLTSSSDGNIQINTDTNGNNQLWKVSVQSDGSYLITSKQYPNKSFDVAGGSNKDFTNIQLYNTNFSNAQKWTLKSAGNYSYYIVSKINNTSVLDVAWGSKQENTNIQLYKLNSTNAQKFKFLEIEDEKPFVEDGVYTINSKLKSSLVISLDNKSENNNVNVNDNMYAYSQAWNIKHFDDGYYKLFIYNDENKTLCYENGDIANGANVFLDEDNNQDNCKWTIKKNYDGTFGFAPVSTNFTIDIAWASTKPGTNIQLYQNNNSNAQKFTLSKVDFTKIEDGIYSILSSVNSIPISLNSEVAINGGNVLLKTNVDENHQKWHIENVQDNIYTIKSCANENYALSIANNSKNDGINVQIAPVSDSDLQKWLIIKFGEDNYRFINVASGKVLDAAWGSIRNGTNIQQYTNNNSNAQKLKIAKTTSKEYKQYIENGKYIIYSALNLDKAVRYSSNVYIYSVEGNNNEFIEIEYAGNGYYTLKKDGKAITNSNNALSMTNYTGNDNQLWFASKNNKYYTFISKIDGLVFDVAWASQSNNTKLQPYASNNSNAQQFYLEAVSDNDLESGYYRIKLNEKYISSLGDIPYDWAKIIATSNDNKSNQTWYFKQISGNLFEIKSAINPNKVFDVAWASKSNGTTIQTYSYNNSNSQKWYVIKLKNGNYKFISKLSNHCFTISGNDAKTYTNDPSKIQSFTISPETAVDIYGKVVTEGYYTITSKLNTSKAVDVAGAYVANGTNVQLYSSNSCLAQIWKFIYLDNGLYYITSALSPKKALSNINGNAQISTYKGSDNQKWYVKMLEENKISLISASDSKYIDVKDAATSNGTNIQLYSSNNSNAQAFILNKYANKKTYRGIDISKYQGNINWDKLVSARPNFVIMRAGYGSYLNQGDEKFYEYYSNATARDLPVGVYTYSYAKNINMAKDEANVLLRWLDGRSLDLPVFYDMEDGSQVSLGKQTLTNMAENFCNIILSNGYKCGIYANKNWFTNYLDAGRLAQKYPIWVAHYTGPDTYDDAVNHWTNYNQSTYQYWQFSSKGVMNGISDNYVDLDFGFDIFD